MTRFPERAPRDPATRLIINETTEGRFPPPRSRARIGSGPCSDPPAASLDRSDNVGIGSQRQILPLINQRVPLTWPAATAGAALPQLLRI